MRGCGWVFSRRTSALCCWTRWGNYRGRTARAGYADTGDRSCQRRRRGARGGCQGGGRGRSSRSRSRRSFNHPSFRPPWSVHPLQPQTTLTHLRRQHSSRRAYRHCLRRRRRPPRSSSRRASVRIPLAATATQLISSRKQTEYSGSKRPAQRPRRK